MLGRAVWALALVASGCGKVGYEGPPGVANGPSVNGPDGGADAVSASFAGEVDWTFDIGDGHGHGLLADSQGNVYFAGHFGNALHLDNGGQGLSSAGGQDFVVAKFTSSGQELWSTSMGGPGDDEAWSMALGSAGAVYVSGSFHDTARFGDIDLISAGNWDAVVFKLDAQTGSVDWAVGMGGPFEDHGMSVTVDGNDNVVVAGYFADNANFPGGTRTSVGDDDIFLISLSSIDGSSKWLKTFGSSGNDQPIEVTASGDTLALTGHFSDTMTVGPAVLVSHGAEDIFVLTASTVGEFAWAQSAGSDGTDNGIGVGFDAVGNLYLGARVGGAVDLGGGPVAGFGDDDGIAASYTADGTLRWAVAMGNESYDRPLAMAVSPAGDSYLTGVYDGDFVVGGKVLTAVGGQDIFMVAFDASGALEGTVGMGGAGDDLGFAVGLDAQGNALLSAIFDGDIAVGDALLSDSFGTFVARLIPTTVVQGN